MTPKTLSSSMYSYNHKSRYQSVSDGEGWFDNGQFDDTDDNFEDDDSLDLNKVFSSFSESAAPAAKTTTTTATTRAQASSSTLSTYMSSTRRRNSGGNRHQRKSSSKLSKRRDGRLSKSLTTEASRISSTTTTSTTTKLRSSSKSKRDKDLDNMSFSGLGGGGSSGTAPLSGDRSVMSMPATSLTPSELALRRLNSQQKAARKHQKDKVTVDGSSKGTSLGDFLSKNRPDDSDEAVSGGDDDDGDDSDNQTFHSMFHWSTVSDGEGLGSTTKRKKFSGARSVGGWSMAGSRSVSGGKSVSGTKSVGGWSSNPKSVAAAAAAKNRNPANARRAAKEDLDKNFDDFLRARPVRQDVGAFSDDGTKSLDTTGFTDGEDADKKRRKKKKSSRKDKKKNKKQEEQEQLNLTSSEKKKKKEKRRSKATSEVDVHETDAKEEKRRRRRRKDKESSESKRRSSKSERRSSKSKSRSKSKSKKKTKEVEDGPIPRSSRRSSMGDNLTTDDDDDDYDMRSEFDSIWDEDATNYESESFTSGDEGWQR